jgi:hypothetical protein
MTLQVRTTIKPVLARRNDGVSRAPIALKTGLDAAPESTLLLRGRKVHHCFLSGNILAQPGCCSPLFRCILFGSDPRQKMGGRFSLVFSYLRHQLSLVDTEALDQFGMRRWGSLRPLLHLLDHFTHPREATVLQRDQRAGASGLACYILNRDSECSLRLLRFQVFVFRNSALGVPAC